MDRKLTVGRETTGDWYVKIAKYLYAVKEK